jgi:hypothetical protein
MTCRVQAYFSQKDVETLRNSPLGEWMLAHRQDVAQLLREREGDWEIIAQRFRNVGLRGLGGRLPSASMVQHTWQAVSADLAAR